jgi:hypothetical protein
VTQHPTLSVEQSAKKLKAETRSEKICGRHTSYI